MNIFDGFKETSDVSDVNKENKSEVSQEAQSKFEKIMGDERLPKAESELIKNDKPDSPFSNHHDKFEDLFKSKVVVNMESAETNTEITPCVADEINQPHEPNSEYKIGDDTYETDDMGNTYKKNGELLPNTEYTINGSTYTTDENGNKISCDAEPEISEEGKRNIAEQRESGGENRKEGDQGGHIIARILGGAEGEENLVPMRGTINQGDYKKMELEIKRALEEGKQVSIHIDLEYDGTSSRPTKITATYYIDGKRTDIVFDNEENSTDLLDTLEGKISDEDFEQLKEEIDDMISDGCSVSVTSVKTEYDENGNTAKVIVGVLDESTGTKSYKVFDAR
ncbi:DNA/RNA non-specific endonuclease [Phascolarctobacterium faecium]|nr:DNA/RNA non-specific endonuclease [Phascolarctobacterium faecium]MDM8109076.1 DNA/RNA non-specific endonuclease [Phascolarctobacterium faecium]